MAPTAQRESWTCWTGVQQAAETRPRRVHERRPPGEARGRGTSYPGPASPIQRTPGADLRILGDLRLWWMLCGGAAEEGGSCPRTDRGRNIKELWPRGYLNGKTDV